MEKDDWIFGLVIGGGLRGGIETANRR